jgi:SAM-dependent methyltransferase
MEHRIGEVSAAWDREYRNGRYVGDPPVPFVRDIVAVASRDGLLGGTGLYIGCGNGRNYLPLVSAGLDLTGLDVSLEALRELAVRTLGRVLVVRRSPGTSWPAAATLVH